jgi:UDP-glucose 4-epimerase
MQTAGETQMPTWRDTPVVVTGATGFIGSHLARRLARLGAQVHAVTRGPAAAADWTWHSVDLTDADATATLIAKVRPAAVFHMASAVTGARDVSLVAPTMAGNLISSVNLLTAIATEAPETRLVLAGSAEEPRLDAVPSSPYAVAKGAATSYAKMFHKLYGVGVTVLRVTMAYGPAQPDLKKLIPYATQSLLRGEEPELASGTRLIDWIYIDDVVDAFLLAAAIDDAAGAVLDIGCGVPVSIRDTIELLAKLVGGTAQPRFGALADRPLDSARVADPTAAAEVLGWRPTTQLAHGLKQTIAWYARNL